MKRLTAAICIAGAALLAGGQAANAGSYNNNNSRTPTLSNTTVSPGGSFSVTVGCEVPEIVGFSFIDDVQNDTCENRTLSEAVQLDGTAVATFTAPAVPGTYTGNVNFTDAEDQTFTIVVEAAPGTTNPQGGGLPPTGSSSNGPAITIASVLLLTGAGMFGVASARRRSDRDAVSV